MPSLDNDYQLTVTTPPAAEPVTVAELKEHLRLAHNELDQFLLPQLIAAARELVETEIDNTLITTSYKLTLDRFPRGRHPLPLPRGPVLTLDEIGYTAPDNTPTVWAAGKYLAAPLAGQLRVQPILTETWPTTRHQIAAAYIDYTAGHGTTPATVPRAARQAILLTCAYWFENPEGQIAADLPAAAARLLEHLQPGWDLEDYAP